MLITALLRTLFFYFFLLVVLRIMGKRELGALGPLDLVVTIIMAEVAAIPIENPNRPVLLGVIPIVTIFVLEISLSYLCLKSEVIRNLISGRPSVVIRHGQMVRGEMHRLRYSVLDLMEQLRIRGYHNLADVEMAMLESDGELSVLPKEHKRPLTPEDLDIKVGIGGPVHTVVVDGEIDTEALHEAGIDEDQLHKGLAQVGITDLSKIFAAFLQPDGSYLVQYK